MITPLLGVLLGALLGGCGYISAAERDARWDLDGDGVERPADCNDHDSAVSPRMPERCDALDIDEDCDGLSDDEDAGVQGPLTRFCLDEDGDGAGAASSAVERCDPPGPGWVEACSDPDDTQPDPPWTTDCGAPPEAALSLDQVAGVAGETVFVADASASTGTELSFRFDWGDSDASAGSSAQPDAAHTFHRSGWFWVTVEVQDSCGRSDRAEAWAAVSEPGALLRVSTALDEDDAEALSSSSWLGQGLSLREALALARKEAGSQLITFEDSLASVAIGPNLRALTDAGEMIVGRGVQVDGSEGGHLALWGPDSVVAGLVLEHFSETFNPALVLGGPRSLAREVVVRDAHMGIGVEGEGAEIQGGRVEGSTLAQVRVRAPATLSGLVVASGEDVGISIDRNGEGTRVALCQIYDHRSSGILLTRHADNVSIVDSTLVRNADGIRIEGPSVDGLELRNTLLAFHSGWGLAGAPASFEAGSPSHNAWYGNDLGDCPPCGPLDPTSTADPMLVDPQGDNLRPLPGSPLIDAGTPETGVDRNGASEGDFLGAGPDIGAIEAQ